MNTSSSSKGNLSSTRVSKWEFIDNDGFTLSKMDKNNHSFSFNRSHFILQRVKPSLAMYWVMDMGLRYSLQGIKSEEWILLKMQKSKLINCSSYDRKMHSDWPVNCLLWLVHGTGTGYSTFKTLLIISKASLTTLTL